MSDILQDIQLRPRLCPAALSIHRSRFHLQVSQLSSVGLTVVPLGPRLGLYMPGKMQSLVVLPCPCIQHNGNAAALAFSRNRSMQQQE